MSSNLEDIEEQNWTRHNRRKLSKDIMTVILFTLEGNIQLPLKATHCAILASADTKVPPLYLTALCVALKYRITYSEFANNFYSGSDAVMIQLSAQKKCPPYIFPHTEHKSTSERIVNISSHTMNIHSDRDNRNISIQYFIHEISQKYRERYRTEA